MYTKKNYNMIKEVLGLNDTQAKLFSFLWKTNKQYCLNDLIKRFNKDRTTLQKIITFLLKNNLVIKHQINLDRGFRFDYKINDKNIIKEDILNKINKIKEDLDKFYITLN